MVDRVADRCDRNHVNFEFPENCTAIRVELRRVLERVCPMDEVRRCLDRATASEPTWAALAELGVLGAAIPEQWGGTGLGSMELATCAEELGRACAPVPSLPSIYLAAEALRLVGTREQRERWLPSMATGRCIGSFAAPSAPLQRLHGRASGHLPLVPAGTAADFLIVAGDPTALLVDLSQRGVRRSPRRSIDPGYPLASIDLEDVFVESLDGPIDRVVDRAAIYLAFDQIGGADRALAMARDYALERRAFGRVVGSYQAVKHKLADVWVGNEIARGHAWYGAWSLMDDTNDVHLAAAAARVSASAAFEHAAQENIQVHGGFGFTWEADCHPLYKRARSSALALGSPPDWRARLADRLHDRTGVAE